MSFIKSVRYKLCTPSCTPLSRAKEVVVVLQYVIFAGVHRLPITIMSTKLIKMNCFRIPVCAHMGSHWFRLRALSVIRRIYHKFITCSGSSGEIDEHKRT